MAAPPLIAFYDESCAFCQAMKARFTRMQRKGANVEWRSLEDAPACGLDGHTCGDAMKVQTADGQVLEGFYAVRVLMGQTKLRWLKPGLHVPGVPWVGRKAYAWVARNRYRISQRIRREG
jgi:predicted DCC family thiol-disulfide oxidoreductase YuxK